MKYVLFSPRMDEKKDYGEIWSCFDQRWIGLFAKSGLVPIVVAPEMDLKRLAKIKGVVGVVFSGGNDVSSYSHKSLDRRRDDLEKKLLKFALSRKLPVLGVCRGMQFLADAYGARLAPVEGHVRKSHRVSFAEGNLFHRIYGSSARVNSYHGYGIPLESIPSTLEVAGVVGSTCEAFRVKNKKVFGIMWHPERNAKVSRADVELFRRIFGGKI